MSTINAESATVRVSEMARDLIGSEILKIAADIRAMIAAGRQVCNLTVGDYNPAQFRIPRTLEERLVEALRKGETNYPPSEGILPLRKTVLQFYSDWLGLNYELPSVLIACGARPVIYATYRAVVDPGDVVVYPVPSWNNNHYCHLAGAKGIAVNCGRDSAFLPTRARIEPHIRGARLLSLNSPQNPSGTAFTREALSDICDMVIEENRRRGPGERPLFVMYDQVYWMLTFGQTKHYDPVNLRPEMAPYTILIDAISKPFASTGLRVGWAVGPKDVVERMSLILVHAGAWAPRAEQVATAAFLGATQEVKDFMTGMKQAVQKRLDALYAGFKQMAAAGLPIDAIEPMGAIYMSVHVGLRGRRTRSGETLKTNEEIRVWLLKEAGVAVVPFQAFGVKEDNGWFRLSVGAVSMDDIDKMMPRLRAALETLDG